MQKQEELLMFSSLIMPISKYFIDALMSVVYMESFLQSRSKKKITIGLWTFIYFILQVIIFEVVARRYPAVDVFAIIINIGLLFILQISLFKKDTVKQLFLIVSFIAGKEILKYISSVAYYVLGDAGKTIFDKLLEEGTFTLQSQVDRYFFIEMLINSIISVLIYGVLFGIYLYIINRKFVKRDYHFSKPELLFLITPAVCALCTSVTIKTMIFSVEEGVPVFVYEKSPSTLFWIPLVCILLLVSVIVTVMIFQNIIRYHEEALKSKVLENQVTQIQKEVSEMQEIYSDVRGIKHDMRNHLANIAAYMANGTKNEELNSYISEMETILDKLDFACNTGNPITDVIIHQKSQEAKKKKIQFSSDFIYPVKKQIDMYDVGVILNNALDNAMEACEKVNGERIIKLRSYEKGNLFFIEISNNYDTITMDLESGLPITDKKDKNLHGFGISNIQKAAKKYMGDIDIEINDEGKIFNLTIMLCKTCE